MPKIKVIIDNELRLSGLDDELREYFRDLLTFTNPKFEQAKAFGRRTNDLPRSLSQYREEGSDCIVPRGLLSHIREDLSWLELEIEDLRADRPVKFPPSAIRLRPEDQEPAIRRLLLFSEGILCAAAGTGKTILGLETANRLSQRTLWLTHNGPLKRQFMERAEMFLQIPQEQIGQLHADKWTIGDQLTVGMIPTLVRRDLRPIHDKFGLIIIDEAHHAPSSSFSQVINQFSAKHIYGLTATPYRNDKLEELMLGSLGPVRVAIEVQPSNIGRVTPEIVVRETNSSFTIGNARDYQEALELLLASPERNQLILQDVARFVFEVGKPAIVLTLRTKHALKLVEDLRNMGISADSLIASVEIPNPEPEKRKRRRKPPKKKHRAIPKRILAETEQRFRNGEIQVLVSTYQFLAEGFDYAPLSALFLAAPLRWRGLVEQSIGRVERGAPGKKNAWVVDYADSEIGFFRKQLDSRYYEVYQPNRLPLQHAPRGQEIDFAGITGSNSP